MIDSRSSKGGAVIRRRRECSECENRFTTYEQIEHQQLMVVKRDGRREEFSREKLLSGISKACQKLPISQLTIEKLADRVYDAITEEYTGEVSGKAIGEAVMNGLLELETDQVACKVAYVRYASVYWRFEDVDDFVQAVKKLETKHDSATYRLPGF